jgi:hypothetical protein
MNLLKKLESKKVFSINKQKNGQFLIEEGCDTYYSVEFTAEELIELAKEIEQLAKTA